jgi:NADPH:quinone reductase-like Zn-dependent oxidoreductase
METMKALRAHQRGGPEQLRYDDAPVPRPGPGEALLVVHAAAITFAEFSWEESWRAKDGTDRTPIIPAHEVSGTVAALGPSVTNVQVGDEVYGLIDFNRDGAAAEYTTVAAVDLARRPASVGHAEAASLPLAALTAWQALADHAKVQPRERVLVQGGAGGVGNYVVQLAAAMGADVTATARQRDAEFVTGLGADRVLAYDSQEMPEPGGFDVVIDTVGGGVLRASYPLLRKGGRLVTLTAPPPPELAGQYGVDVTFFVVRPDRRELAHLAELVDSGRLRPVVAGTYPLEQGRAAYESSTTAHAPGKTVLIVR